MGLRDDVERFREVGEERREDLKEFIQYGELGGQDPDSISIPIKVVDLPSFEYDQLDKGGVGQGQGGQPDVGQPVGDPQPGDGEEEGEPGDEDGEHEYYEMDPEEFAEEMDEEFNLNLDPKGKQVIEEIEGDFNEFAKQGANMDDEYFFKEGLKRGLSLAKDEDYLKEVLKVEGWGAEKVFKWASGNEEWSYPKKIPISRPQLDEWAAEIEENNEESEWESLDKLVEDLGDYPDRVDIFRRNPKKTWEPRKDDERYRHPEIIERKEKNVAMFFIRDVSGSMREKKQELTQRSAIPLHWYLTGKYEEAEDRYVAFDNSAEELPREKWFGIKTGGGTTASTGVKLAAEIAEEEYPWNEWNRYFFIYGDGENSSNDTTENVVPVIEETDANLWAYTEVQPGKTSMNANMYEDLDRNVESDNYIGTQVHGNDDVMDSIVKILGSEDDEE